MLVLHRQLRPADGFGAAAPAGVSRGSDLHDKASKADVYNSPGWRRMETRAGNRPVAQPVEARNIVIDLTAEPAHAKGTWVFHQKFGYGEVLDAEGDKLTIEFEKAGTKRVLAGYVTSEADVPF